MKTRSLLFLIPCCLLISSIFAQSNADDVVFSIPLSAGVVIENVAKNSEAEKAGLQAGDVILSWRRGDAKGQIETPFDLGEIEIEQSPRGNVTLEGLRKMEQRNWTIGPGVWGMEARPDFHGKLLDIYLEGRELSSGGKAGEAAARWRTAAAEAQKSHTEWLGSWLLLHAADTLTSTHQWKEADEAYQQSTQQIAGTRPVIESQLLRAWALKYEQRADWRNAERRNQACVAETQKSSTDTLLTAWCLFGLGNMFRLSNDFAKAEEYLAQSLEIRRRQAPGSLAVAAAANNLGLVAQDRSNLEQAERYLNEALEIREKQAPNGLDVAASLNNLGSVAEDQGDWDKAEQYDLRALAIKEALAPGSLDTAFTYSNLGMVYFGRGDLSKAEEYMYRSFEIRKKLAPDGPDIAENLGNLGTVRWRCGDLATAEHYYLAALTVQEKFAPASQSLASTLDNLGNLALSQQDLKKARTYHDRALQIRRRIAPFSLDVSNSLDNLGNLEAEEGNLEKAARYYRRALAMQEKLAPNSPPVATSLSNLGDVAKRRGDLATAEKYYLRALNIEEKLAPDSLDTAETLKNRGDVARGSNNLALAQELYQRALTIQERLAPGSAAYAESLAALASILRAQQQPDLAARLFERALDALETQTNRLGGSQDLRSEFRAKYSDYYKDYIDLLIQQKRTEEAFHVAERRRARSLLEMLAAARVDIHHGADPELLQRERSLQESMNAKRERKAVLLTGKHTAEQAEAAEKEIEGLRAEYDQVESRLRATSPAYAALTQPQPLTVNEIQRLLDHDTLLLEYSLGEKRSYLWAVTSTAFTTHELPRRSVIEATARRLYQQVSVQSNPANTAGGAKDQRQNRLNMTAAVMSRLLLGPVVKQLPGKRLVVIADGALQHTPFAFLPQPGRPGGDPLILAHEITFSPSASVVAELRREAAGRKPAPKAVAVLADPVFDRTDARVSMGHNRSQPASTRRTTGPRPLTRSMMRSAADVGLIHLSRLPFSRREADAIMTVTPAGQGLEAVGFDANRATATSPDLAQYRVVHFATHALSDNHHPELSGLVLSLVNENGAPQNGFLDLQDIYNLNLPADLVVLSGCETALGEEIQGEGIIGLTRGFMYAGATRVVASLWSVDDASTKMLMEGFYRAMEQENMRPAAALRAAQIAMWKQLPWRAPFYWAAFQIQGEWK